MRRQMLVFASVALVAFAGCRHHCRKPCDSCAPPPGGSSGARPILLPPAGVPTTPVSPVPSVGPSGYPPPASVVPPSDSGGPKVLFPDALPGSPSSTRPGQPSAPNFLGAPVKPQSSEPPKAPTAGTAGLPGYTKVKDGLFAGGKPTLDGFDSLKAAGFRSAIYLHAPGADVSAVKDMATTRGLNFVAIETAPETLSEASKKFDQLAADRLTRPAYVFADDPMRAGAVWYLHFRTADALGDDVARLRARPLGLNETTEEGKAFALAIQAVLATR